MLGLSSMFQSAQPVVLLPHDGVCNAIPGWVPTWEPTSYKADPDCKLHPFYGHRGMGTGASFGGSSYAVAPAAGMTKQMA